MNIKNNYILEIFLLYILPCIFGFFFLDIVASIGLPATLFVVAVVVLFPVFILKPKELIILENTANKLKKDIEKLENELKNNKD